MFRYTTFVIGGVVLTGVVLWWIGILRNPNSMHEVREFDVSVRILAVEFSPDGQAAIAGGYGGVYVWDVKTGKVRQHFAKEASPNIRYRVTCMSVAADGKTVLTGGEAEAGAALWRLEDGSLLHRFQTPARVQSVALSPDGRFALAGSGHLRPKQSLPRDLGVYPIYQWNLPTHEQVRSFEGHLAPVTGIAVLPDGKRMLTASKDMTLRLWDLETGKELRSAGKVVPQMTVDYNGIQGVLSDDPNNGIPLSLSHNGRYAIWGSKFWNVEEWKEIGSLAARPDALQDARVLGGAFSPDDRLMLTGHKDGKIRLWYVRGYDEITSVDGFINQAEVFAVAFSPDGRMALSGGEGGIAGFTAINRGVRASDPKVRLWKLPLTIN